MYLRSVEVCKVGGTVCCSTATAAILPLWHGAALRYPWHTHNSSYHVAHMLHSLT